LSILTLQESQGHKSHWSDWITNFRKKIGLANDLYFVILSIFWVWAILPKTVWPKDVWPKTTSPKWSFDRKSFDRNGHLTESSFNRNGHLTETSFDRNGRLTETSYDRNVVWPKRRLTETSFVEHSMILRPVDGRCQPLLLNHCTCNRYTCHRSRNPVLLGSMLKFVDPLSTESIDCTFITLRWFKILCIFKQFLRV
jgi:hypothetical protein